MRLFNVLLILIFFACTVAATEIIKNGSFQANSNGSNVILVWITLDESNVHHFEVERRTGIEGAFTFIGEQNPKGSSEYTFTDYSTFKKTTTIYQYRVKIVFSDGTTSVYTEPCTVDHTVSGIRRTWGSIKAMFR